MPKPAVPAPSRVAEKWVRRAGAASVDYVDGVKASTKSQSGNAVAARAVWVQQVTSKDVQDRWEAGLKRAGDEAFRRGVEEKGQNRYGPGVQASQAKFAGRITNILAAIAGVDIPMRGLPASEQNFQRNKAIGQALNKARGTFAR